jgi:TRAP-type C4-dicarboxylate transport system substrate-binding protein
MDMKTFLHRLIIGVGLALLAVGTATAQQFTMRLSSPTVNDVTHEWMKAFKAGVESRTGGRIKVEIYPANQLGQIPATVEGVAVKTIEFTAPATGFLIGLEPRFQIFDAPGLFDNMEHAQRVLTDPEIRKRLATFGAAKGVEPLVVFPHGPLMLLSHKPIRAVADFNGQKIRVAGPAPIQIEPFKKLGASPLSMPLGEVLPALQNRAIDGSIASATVFTAFKYYDVAKALTYLPGSFLIVGGLVNREYMKSLGPELEAIVRDEAIKAQLGVTKWANEDVERAMQTWQKNGGEIIKLPPAEAKLYLQDVASVLPSILDKSQQMKDDYEAFLAAGKKYRQ